MLIMILTETTDTKVQGHFVDDEDEGRLAGVPFLIAGKRNANGRVYSIEIVTKAIDELKKKLKAKRTFGSTKHLEKGLEVDDVSHVIEDVDFDPTSNTAVVDLKILKTAKGRNLLAILRGGGALGLSSRGVGECGKDGVVKSFNLLGIDFCTDPAAGTFADRSFMFESRQIEEDVSVTEKELTKEQLADRYLFALSAGFKGTFAQYREALDSKKG